MPKKSEKRDTKRGKGGKSGGSFSRPSSGGITKSFVGQFQMTLAGGVGSMNLDTDPGSGGVFGSSGVTMISDLADEFGFYKVSALKFRLLADTAAKTVDTIVAFSGKDPQTTAPTTAKTLAELPCHVRVTIGSTAVFSPQVVVPPEILMGTGTWYQTMGGSTGFDAEELIQGVFYALGSTTLTLTIEIEGVIHFKNPLDAANTPLPVPSAERAVLKAVRRLLMSREYYLKERQEQRAEMLLVLGVELPGTTSEVVPLSDVMKEVLDLCSRYKGFTSAPPGPNLAWKPLTRQ